MRTLLSAAAAALLAAAPLAAQTLTIAPDASGAEIGPFGDPTLGATPRIGQTFRPLATYLQSFAFSLRNDDGTGASLRYRASIGDFTGGTLGSVLYTTPGDIAGVTSVATGGVRVAYPLSATPLNLLLDPSKTYVAFLSVVGTPGGTNTLTTAGGDVYANGTMVYDLGAGLESAGGDDLAFDATFSRVAVSAVPEPATLALVFGGVTLLGLVRRRARR